MLNNTKMVAASLKQSATFEVRCRDNGFEVLKAYQKQFYRALHRWYLVGIIDTIIPLVILAIMAIKPNF